MIYLSQDDNTTRDSVKKAEALIGQAHNLIAPLAGQQFKSEFDEIEALLIEAFKKIEDLQFNQGG